MVIDRFYFSSGDSAGSLDELLEKLKSMDEDCFEHHVNEDKNDFAAWISECVGDKALAKRISTLKERREIIKVIAKKVNTPAKVKKGIIAQIKEAIVNE
jgi:hypothetical protein